MAVSEENVASDTLKRALDIVVAAAGNEATGVVEQLASSLRNDESLSESWRKWTHSTTS